MVLRNKGLAEEVLTRFSDFYEEGITIPIINNIPGKAVPNNRLSLRQGDRPSGVFIYFYTFVHVTLFSDDSAHKGSNQPKHNVKWSMVLLWN